MEPGGPGDGSTVPDQKKMRINTFNIKEEKVCCILVWI